MEDWKNIGLELLDVMSDALSPYVTSYASLTMAYRSGDVDNFNKQRKNYTSALLPTFQMISAAFITNETSMRFSLSIFRCSSMYLHF